MSPRPTHTIDWARSRMIVGELGSSTRVFVAFCGARGFGRDQEAMPWWSPTCEACQVAVAASLLDRSPGP